MAITNGNNTASIGFEQRIWAVADKQDLRKMTGISSASIAKLGKGENVKTEILLRICKVLECDISDIMEFVPDKDN